VVTIAETEDRASSEPLLEVKNLVREFSVESGGKHLKLQAVSGVSFRLRHGETLGIVGESGCGKTTMARIIMQRPRPTSGDVLINGVNLTKLSPKEVRKAIRQMQMVFQDPYVALDPRYTVEQSIMEPLIGHNVGTKTERKARVNEVLEFVGLDPKRYRDRHPRQLSGGQCQRVAIARAISISPEVVICDEAVSALDALVQAQILNLLDDLRSEFGFSYLFISHNLSVIRQVSDRVAVMYLGKVAEIAPTQELFRNPRHPYTAGLLAANPVNLGTDPDHLAGRNVAVIGEPASALNPPSGCRYRTRCPFAQDRCAEEEPILRAMGTEHEVACHFPIGVASEAIA
jgi:oligopeptide transport system ATP-binding protein